MFFENIAAWLANAQVYVSGVFQYISEIFLAIVNNPIISEIGAAIDNIVQSNVLVASIIFFALGAVIALFGKKMIGVIKFCAFFLVGFCVAVQYVSPLLDNVFVIPHWIVGLIIGVVAAVLFKVLYAVLYYVLMFAVPFAICYYGIIIEAISYNLIVAAVVGVVVLLLGIFFRKYIEMLYTSYLGSWIMVITAFVFWIGLDTLAFVNADRTLWLNLITLVLTVPCFAVQLVTRKRY